MALTTEIYLCKNTKLSPGSEDTYYFATESARQAFFISKSPTGYHITAMSFIREERAIRVALGIESVDECDYLMFKNTAYGSKWYYAFITGVKYINDTCTEISFEIDPIQTWITSCTFGTQFIERETVADDTFGKHILEEGLNAGKLYPYSSTEINSSLHAKSYLCFVVKRAPVPLPYVYRGGGRGAHSGSTVTATTLWNLSAGSDMSVAEMPIAKSNANNILQSYLYMLIPASKADGVSLLVSDFLSFYTNNLVWVDEDNVKHPTLDPDDIVGCFSCPASVLDSSLATLAASHGTAPILLGAKNSFSGDGGTTFVNADYNSTRDGIFGATSGGVGTAVDVTINTAGDGSTMFNGYVPQNKKCLISPFVGVRVQDYNGAATDLFKPELFSANKMSVGNYTLFNSLTVSRFITVSGYDSENVNNNILELGDVPHYSFNTNTIDSWYAAEASYRQNRQITERFSDLTNVIMNKGGGSVLGSIVTGLSLSNKYGNEEMAFNKQVADISRMAPVSRGNNSGNLFLAYQDKDGAVAIKYCAHGDMVKAADNYFTKYGYKVNRKGAMSFTSRSRFNYLKTDGLNITAGNIPAKIRDELTAIFTRGIRFWHGDYLGDYSAANTIAS